jgi:hypothetical protein
LKEAALLLAEVALGAFFRHRLELHHGITHDQLNQEKVGFPKRETRSTFAQ